MNIYVGNMAYEVTEDDLQEAFEEHGKVSSVSIIKDKYSGRSKGFGFVEMPNDSEAQAAITALNGIDMMGRTLNVNQARPREEGGRPRGGGGGGGGRRGGGYGGGGRSY